MISLICSNHKIKFIVIQMRQLICEKGYEAIGPLRVVTLTNHNRRKQHNEPIRSRSKCM